MQRPKNHNYSHNRNANPRSTDMNSNSNNNMSSSSSLPTLSDSKSYSLATAGASASSARVTPDRKDPPKAKATGGSHNSSTKKSTRATGTHNHHLTVDKQIIDELLLVCSVIGSTSTSSSSNKAKNHQQNIIPVNECLHWLQDLQRALRRDEDAYRPISLLLGQWKIVQQKLLPLVLSCKYDTKMILTIVKILVILTKPLSENAKNAAKLIIDVKSKHADEEVIEEQIKLRDNAIAQANLLKEYKQLFVHHPSHRTTKSGKGQKGGSGGLLSIFVSLLTEPLSRTGMMRSNDDHLTVELILHLFRNLLCAGEPFIKDQDTTRECAKLHQELITLFEQELVLDVLLVIGQEMESRENSQYNLLVMEIMHHLLKSQDPTLVARSAKGEPHSTNNDNNSLSNNKNDKRYSNKNPNFKAMKSRFQHASSHSLSTSKTGSLRDKLFKERQRLHAVSSSRHSHFGGTLILEKIGGGAGGKDQTIVVSATTAPSSSLSTTSTSKSSGLIQCNRSTLSQVDAKRKTKNHQYFIGSGRPVSAYYSRLDAVQSSCMYTGPISQRAQQTLHKFCCDFLTNCYGPVMKSLKTEFQKESNRLEDEDKVIFFRIVWFFCQWWRVFAEEGGGKIPKKNVDLVMDNNGSAETTSIGNLVFTMDMFTFNMVLSSLDFYLEHRKYKNIVQTVSLYTEMIRLLHSMYTSKDSMEHIMAMGLMDNLFYKQDCIDKLPKLLTRWTPGTYPIDYLCDLMELTHMTLKVLDINEKACSKYAVTKEKKRKKGKQVEEEPQDRVTRMKEKAAEFDTSVYLARKIISNQVMFMFTQLLGQYSYNSPRINDHIVAFFVRLCKFIVAKDEDFDFLDVQAKKENEANSVTLEPMLFNIHLLTVINEILNDRNLRNDKDFVSLISFGSTLIRHYARTCEKNPMLFVETLFRHSLPHRYCETLLNNYVSEELKMIAEREILLEQQHAPVDDDDEEEEMIRNEQSDDEDEMEFEDEDEYNRVGKQSDVPRVVMKSNNNNDEGESEEEQEMEFVDMEIGAEKVTNDKDDEEEVMFDDVREAVELESALNNETDVDDKWNDRRAFVPKRQRQNYADDCATEKEKKDEESISSDNENIKDGKNAHLQSKRKNDSDSVENESENEETVAPASDHKSKRIKRAVLDDSSDEEDFGDTQIDTIQSQSQSKPTNMFDDSDEDD